MKATEDENRKEVIELLVFMTGRPPTYFENFTNERLEEVYDQYNQPEGRNKA